ncbi:hypothetical protein [Aeromicrobium alkaliterrae]|uniref:Uncharacterized protein n=1 Tax=Aeromicrobium alkaliterrae TaxID=302168 RepID=A0ABP4VUC4_9ACTN
MSEPITPPSADVDDARRFALSEDWLATIAGLAVVALAAAGVITADWIPL